MDGIESEFWARVNKTNDCWLWTGGKTGMGYGMFCRHNQHTHAHRLCWELVNGPIPTGMCVLHKCDNPICVRPDHLFLGTQADNMADCQAKGRFAKGERNGHHKVTAQQVTEIRRRYAAGESQSGMAEEYGVDPSTISNMITRETWKAV